MYRKFYFLALCVLVSSIAYSQSGTLAGKVLDKRQHPITGASVFVLNTNLAAISNTDGAFEIKNISAGHYTVAVAAIGFAAINQNVNVTANGNAPVSFTLEDATNQLEAVVVTAEKSQENVQDLPISISALTAKNINDYRLWNTRDLTAIVPNLYAGNPGDGRNVTSIRGITSSSYDPAVTTYIDGVNQFTLDTYIPQLFDVDRIEVLRGPQGTLYGRNAMGGVVNIITKQPTNTTDGFAEASVGNYGLQRYAAGIRTPLIKDKLFFGAAGLYEGLNGYYTNDYDNSKFDKQHSIGTNFYLKYLASSRWALTLNVKQMAARNWGSFPLAGSVDDAFAKPFHLDQNAKAKLVDNTFNTSLSVNYAGSGFNFSSQTAYQSNYRYYAQPIDGDFAPIDGVTIVNNYGSKWNNVKVLTQEFKFSSPANTASPFKWTAGTYLFYQNTPNKQGTHFGEDAQYVGSPQTDYTIINTTKAKTNGFALFAQGTYTIMKNFDVTGGVRYDYQHTKESVLGEYQPDGSPTPVFDTQADTSATASYSAFSPTVSFAVRATDNTNLYVTYSRGYRTGGLTQLSADPSSPPLYAYKPEYSNNFELGVKNTLLNNKLKLNVALFYTTITNAQVPTLVLPSAVTITKNAGGLTSKGVDAELAATPVKGLEATYNFGYTHARYTTLKVSSNGSESNLAGNHQIFTPDVTSMLAVQYSLPVNDAQTVKVFVRGEWQYLGQTYFDLANNIRQSPYNLLNASVGVTTKHVDVMLWGRNLTDKKYISYAYDFGAVHLGNPQTFGVTVRGKL